MHLLWKADNNRIICKFTRARSQTYTFLGDCFKIPAQITYLALAFCKAGLHIQDLSSRLKNVKSTIKYILETAAINPSEPNIAKVNRVNRKLHDQQTCSRSCCSGRFSGTPHFQPLLFSLSRSFIIMWWILVELRFFCSTKKMNFLAIVEIASLSSSRVEIGANRVLRIAFWVGMLNWFQS